MVRLVIRCSYPGTSNTVIVGSQKVIPSPQKRLSWVFDIPQALSFSSKLLLPISVYICIYIVVNSRPPACEQPRITNSGRFAHRTCNSVATFRIIAENQSRVCFKHTTTLSVFYPRVTGSDRRIIDLPNYSRG